MEGLTVYYTLLLFPTIISSNASPAVNNRVITRNNDTNPSKCGFLETFMLAMLTETLFSGCLTFALDYQPAFDHVTHNAAPANLGALSKRRPPPKRYSYPIMYPFIDGCPIRQDNELSTSKCEQENKFGGGWKIKCNPLDFIYPYPDRFRGRCRDSELCVTKTGSLFEYGDPPRRTKRAWCVSGHCFARLAENILQTPMRTAVLDLGNSSASDLEIFLDQPNGTVSSDFTARRMTLTARDAGHHALGSPVMCSNCSSLDFPNPPNRTAEFYAAIELRNVDDVANLWTSPLDHSRSPFGDFKPSL